MIGCEVVSGCFRRSCTFELWFTGLRTWSGLFWSSTQAKLSAHTPPADQSGVFGKKKRASSSRCGSQACADGSNLVAIHATWLVRHIDTRTTRLLMTVITALLTTFPRPRAVFSQCRNSNIMRALVRKTECQNSKPMNPAGRSYCTADNVKSVQRYSA